MNKSEWLALASVLAAIGVGIPAWIGVARNRRTKDLAARIRQFRQAFASEIRARRSSASLSVEDFADCISRRISTADVIEWEQHGEVPAHYLDRVLDVLGISDWDYRVLALRYVDNEEYDRHLEPSGSLGSIDSALVAARQTWCVTGRYSRTHIPVVAAKSKSRSQFRNKSSVNYTYIDNLTDRDSLVEIARLLSRLFPYADVSMECSEAYPASLKSRPSVILGGIGVPGSPNNEFALEIFQALGIDVVYSDISLAYDGRTWRSEERSGLLVKDTGLFARIRSPIEPEARLILVQGTHTRGVFGATKAFCLSEQALKNHATVKRVAGDRDFVAIFDVEIVSGDVVVPVLDESSIFIL